MCADSCTHTHLIDPFSISSNQQRLHSTNQPNDDKQSFLIQEPNIQQQYNHLLPSLLDHKVHTQVLAGNISYHHHHHRRHRHHHHLIQHGFQMD